MLAVVGGLRADSGVLFASFWRAVPFVSPFLRPPSLVGSLPTDTLRLALVRFQDDGCLRSWNCE